MMADPGFDAAGDEAQEALARACAYELIARFLLHPQDVPLDWLSGRAHPQDPADDALSHAWHRLASASRAGPGALVRAHAALFIAPGTPPLNPYASFYLDGAMMNTALLRLRQEMRSLGLMRREGATEPEDQLGVLCESMAQLIERHTGPEVQAAFLERHVLPWALRCLDDIRNHPDAGIYTALAAFAAAFLASEAQALGADALADAT